MSEESKDKTRPASKEEFELAKSQCCGDDVQIDDDAVVAEIHNSKNFWVSSWVYVRRI